VLNSRLLTALSDDSSDLSALTPAHFLIGGPINTIPEPSLTKISSRLNRWQLLRQKLDHFWHRWSVEYLQRLQARSKWQTVTDQVIKGAFVLIADQRFPPSKWPLARVIDTHPGTDGLTRRYRANSNVRIQAIDREIMPIARLHGNAFNLRAIICITKLVLSN
jgi:hypothetical protein